MPPKRAREPLTAAEEAQQSALEASLFGSAPFKARPRPVSTRDVAPAPLPDDQLFVLDAGSGGRAHASGSDSDNDNDSDSDSDSAPRGVAYDSETDYEASERRGSVAATDDDNDDDDDDNDNDNDSDDKHGSDDGQDEQDAVEKSRRDGRPAWTDPDDKRLQVALAGPSARAADGGASGTGKLRKLRLFPGEEAVDGEEFARRLRALHARTAPAPPWAARMFRRPPVDDDAASAGAASASLAALLASDKPMLSAAAGAGRRAGNGTGKAGVAPLPAHQLVVTRVRDVTASMEETQRSAVDTMQFYPAATGGAPLLATGSRDRRVRLWSLPSLARSASAGSAAQQRDPGGQLVLQAHVPHLPLRTVAWATVGPTASALLAGDRPFLYAWDLGSQQIVRSAPWRLSGSGSTGDHDARSLANAKPMPIAIQDRGGKDTLLAIRGRQGEIHLIDWGRSGAGSASVIATLQAPGPLADIAWDVTSGAADGSTPRLMSLTTAGELGVWDTRMLRSAVRATDSDLFKPSRLSPSPDGSTVAVGAANGIVSLYDMASLSASANTASGNQYLSAEAQAAAVAAGQLSTVRSIKPRTTLNNLTTAITSMAWHPRSEMMAVASLPKRDGMRVVHSKSGTVFANWPTSNTPLAHISGVDFDPAGRALAVSNSKGKVLLYRLAHYD